MEFGDPAGSVTGRLLPTGNARDRIELADGRSWLSVVVTRGLSDWSQQPAPSPDASGFWTVRAVRDHDSVQVFCGDQPIRLAPLSGSVVAGPMCAAPEGPGFTALFERV
jgi:regulation of enolase protein 1 (concanavalin A-like superfamily)